MTNGGATVVRGVLQLSVLGYSQRSDSPIVLLDAGGRRVMELQPGATDVRHLSPGVYFVREAYGIERQASSVSKVVIAR